MSCAYITEIQPTMQRLVALLQGWGYETTDSGDGVLNVEAGMEGALDYPHVLIRYGHKRPKNSTDDLVFAAYDLRDRLYKVVRPMIAVVVEASYSTADEIAILSVSGLTDKDLMG